MTTAAIITEIGKPFEVVDIQLDAPNAHEVLVEVKASGLCHSDIHIATTARGIPTPLLLGHEIAGVVQEVGTAVTEFKPGDHVTVCQISGCGECPNCRLGMPNRCTQMHVVGRSPEETPRVTLDGKPVMQFVGIGGFADTVLVNERLLVKVDKAIPWEAASMLGCGVVAGACAVINTAGVRPRDTVAVIGCGGVGLNAIQGARLVGARRIIAVDLNQTKLELARRFGATDVINGSDVDVVEAVRKLTGGGVDHAFEVIGLAPTAKQALQMLVPGGTAYLIGVQKFGTVLDFDLAADLMFPQKSFKGVSMGSVNPRVDIPMFGELYLQGRFLLDELISRRIGVGEINEGYELLAQGEVARSVITSFQ